MPKIGMSSTAIILEPWLNVLKIAAENENVEFALIENMPIDEALRIKQSCDILIDQVGNRGGWGYGMNSVEALAMGLVSVTELIPEYVDFIPDHPFVNVTAETLYDSLKEIVENKERLIAQKELGRKWVVKHHDMHNTAEVLYKYYGDLGWL